jgi:dipeptidyl aminopeptidase/acylaminoacyl peptidase
MSNRPALGCAAATLLALVLAAPLEAQQKRAFTPADWYRVTTVSSPAVSPDGQRVALTVTTVRERENSRHSEIWVVPTSGGEPVRWTSPGTESSNPRWSHDGKYLFFTSQRQGGRGSTWSIRVDQPSGEAMQVQGYPDGSMPADRSFAVFTAPAGGDQDDAGDAAEGRDNPFADMPSTARPPFGSVTKPVDPARFDGRHIVDFPYKANGRGFIANRSDARSFRPAQLWRQPVGDTARTRITSTAYSHGNAAVSPDGRWIAFTAHPDLLPDSVTQMERDSIAKLPYDANRDEADRNDSDVFIISVDGGEPRRLTSAMGSERSLAWSPDGRRIAFVGSPRRTASNRLWVIDVAGGEPRDLLGDWAYEPGSFEWLGNGDILMDASTGGSDGLFRINSRSGQRTQILSGRRRINGTSLDARQTRIAFVATSLAHPTELFIADVDGKNERKLTGFNDKLLAEVAFTDGERFTYESVGGLEIEAWLLKPYGYDPAKRYPLVLYIHGGPHSAYGENWFDEFQNITGAGMFVLFTNPRGSSGYGADFT